MDGKCVILYESHAGWVYHAGGPVDAAETICRVSDACASTHGQ